MTLTPFEVAELDQVVQNGQTVAAQLAGMGKFTQAGIVDALCRATRSLQRKLTAEQKPVPAEPPADAPPAAEGSG